MIYGIGVDCIEVERIKKIFLKNDTPFLKKIAMIEERIHEPKHFKRRVEYWAARFAFKEAFAKALGTGIGKTMSFSSIGILKNKQGKPQFICVPPIKKILIKKNISQVHVSLTHTTSQAMAFVVLEMNSV